MNRYPRRGRVVMTRGRSASSLSTARIRRHQSQKKLYRLSVSDISVDDIAMPTAANRVPDDLQHLFPLTPAVFFILFALADGEKHGYAIMLSASELSAGQFRMGPGTLYSTIQRLLDMDLIEETEGTSAPSDHENRRRYYKLTGVG